MGEIIKYFLNKPSTKTWLKAKMKNSLFGIMGYVVGIRI